MSLDPFYEHPDHPEGTVFDKYDPTFGPIMAALQAGEFDEAARLTAELAELTAPNTHGMVIPGHPRWEEFCDRLNGPEGCDFKKDPDVTWRCGGGNDKSYATTILTSMGLSLAEIAGSLAYYHDRGGHCDCEILFNVA